MLSQAELVCATGSLLARACRGFSSMPVQVAYGLARTGALVRAWTFPSPLPKTPFVTLG